MLPDLHMTKLYGMVIFALFFAHYFALFILHIIVVIVFWDLPFMP